MTITEHNSTVLGNLLSLAFVLFYWVIEGYENCMVGWKSEKVSFLPVGISNFQDSFENFWGLFISKWDLFREFSTIMKSDIVPSRHLLLTLHFHASSSPMDAWPFKGSGYGMKIQRWNPFVLYRRYNSFNIHYFQYVWQSALTSFFKKNSVWQETQKVWLYLEWEYLYPQSVLIHFVRHEANDKSR